MLPHLTLTLLLLFLEAELTYQAEALVMMFCAELEVAPPQLHIAHSFLGFIFFLSSGAFNPCLVFLFIFEFNLSDFFSP